MPKKNGLISVSDLFKNSFKLYKKSWKTLLVFSFIIVFAWNIWLEAVLPFLLTAAGVGTLSTGIFIGSFTQGINATISGFLILALSLLFIFEIEFLGSAAIIISLSEYFKGKKPNLNYILTEAKKLLVPITITSLLVFSIEFGGFLLVIIPGIIFTILLQFTNFILVIEKKSPVASLNRSRQLVKINFFGITGRYLVIGIASFCVNFLFSSQPSLQLVSQALILPFTITYHFLLYKDVSERK